MKGQTTIHTSFVFMLAVIIGGAILIIGYKAVSSVIQTEAQSRMQTLAVELRELAPGDSLEMLLPPETNEVCFIDQDLIGFERFDPQTYFVHPDIIRSVRMGDGQNVFFIGSKVYSTKVRDLSVERHVLCKKTDSGRVRIGLRSVDAYPEVYFI